jgi:hypothetical protein
MHICVKDPNTVDMTVHGEGHCKIHCNSAFAYASFATYHGYLMSDLTHPVLEPSLLFQ